MNRDAFVLKQWWEIDRLVILRFHQADLWLYLYYWQFKHFVYQTFLQKTNQWSDYLAHVLTKQD